MAEPRRVVAVVGAGVSGLATAYHLRRLLPDAHVVVVEAADRAGGKVLTQQVAGNPVDAGPDSLLMRVPAMVSLLDQLGLTDAVVAPGVTGAYVWSRRRLRRLPPSTVFGVPQRLLPLLRSGLLSPRGFARAGADLVLPRPRPVEDPSIGQLLRPRFGREVFDRIVDPLLGGVHAGRADQLSARSAVPQVAALIEGRRSIYRAARRAAASGPSTGRPSSPALVTLQGGLGRLTDALGADVADLRLGTEVRQISSGSNGFCLHGESGELRADAVVLATPAHVSARLLADLAPGSAAAAAAIPHADVASLTLVYPAAAVHGPLSGTGFLVPPEERMLLVGCSWLPVKWPHLADPSRVLIRAMVGRHGDDTFTRLDDEQLVAEVHRELRLTMRLTGPPEHAVVQRWPQAMPQYTVGHQQRLDQIARGLDGVPGLHVTGAAYRGVGIASCVSNAVTTAESVAAELRHRVPVG